MNFTAKILALEADAKLSKETAKTLSANADQIWILLSGFLVFWMHAGFSMLEAGSVRAKNTINILFKNIVTVCIGAFAYFFVGYAFAYGADNAGEDSAKFIGSGMYFVQDVGNKDKHSWFFQYAFAATAATIVSGAVAERTQLTAYFLVALYLCAFVYPVVSHWIWADGGWLSAWTSQNATTGLPERLFSGSNPNPCGMVDYAGSAVVHLVGGTAGLVGAIMVGPRTDRFVTSASGSPVVMPMAGHNISLCAIGTFILWFGWFGFNCGSTLAFDGQIASKVAVTTVMSPSAACLVAIFVNKLFLSKSWDLGTALNCVLAGLVSITAGCSVVEDWHAMIIGAIGAGIYLFASATMKRLCIDDPLDAVAVHGACGIWGCLAVGIFATKDNIAAAYGDTCPSVGNEDGWQFAAQLTGVVAVIVWTAANMILIFGLIKVTMGLRVTEEEEAEGLDASEHGGAAYELGDFPTTAATLPVGAKGEVEMSKV